MNILFRLTWGQQILAVLLAEYLMNRVEADPTMVYKDCTIMFLLPAILFANAAWRLQNQRQTLHYSIGIYIAIFVYVYNHFYSQIHYGLGQVFLYIFEGAIVAILGIWITSGDQYYSNT